MRFEESPFPLVLPALAFRNFAYLIGVRDKGVGEVRKIAAVQVFAPADAIAPLEIPIGRHLRGGRQSLLARRPDDALFPCRYVRAKILGAPLRRSSLSFPS